MWNLAALTARSGSVEVEVLHFGEYGIADLWSRDAVLISPGPGLPGDFPILRDVILSLGTRLPILGICLGHQAIAEAFGAALCSLAQVRHGKEALLQWKEGCELGAGSDHHSVAGLYHSWAVSQDAFPEELEVIATDQEGVIMGIRHRLYPITGLQFHPESYITKNGEALMQQWLRGIK